MNLQDAIKRRDECLSRGEAVPEEIGKIILANQLSIELARDDELLYFSSPPRIREQNGEQNDE